MRRAELVSHLVRCELDGAATRRAQSLRTGRACRREGGLTRPARVKDMTDVVVGIAEYIVEVRLIFRHQGSGVLSCVRVGHGVRVDDVGIVNQHQLHVEIDVVNGVDATDRGDDRRPRKRHCAAVLGGVLGSCRDGEAIGAPRSVLRN